jgi:hypothetical protein
MKVSQTQLECMQEAVENIVEKNRETIEERYGENSADPQEYHNVPHTDDVTYAVRTLGDLALARDKITVVQRILLPILASGHDRYYDAYDKSRNEEISATETLALMESYSCFEDEHFDLVKKGIMATKVSQFSPRIIQEVDPSHYPSLLLADADLSSFGMPFDEFWPRATAYQKELERTKGIKMTDYISSEITLLKLHQWHTDEASQLFPHAQENAAILEKQAA